MNPAVTLTFLRLRKIPPWDAFYYVVFQFLGGLGGVLFVAGLLGPAFTRAPVSFVVTVPGPAGAGAAFAGETAVAALMMGMIVSVSNRRTLARYTGLLAGILIALYVAFEAPLSGFGMNPARTTASALPSGIWTSFWIYLCAPLLGMLAAGEGYARIKGAPPVRCCKLHHSSSRPCIFCGERILAGF